LNPVEIELAIYGSDAEYYRAELKCDFVDEQDNQIDAPINALFKFPKEELERTPTDQDYGSILTDAVFSDSALKMQFVMATANARLRSLPIRIRLRIDRTARQLNSVNWELLLDPGSRISLTTSQNIYFSRFLARNDYNAIKLKRRAALSALTVASNPTNLGDGPYMYPLPPIDMEAEIRGAHDNLVGVRVTTLPVDQKATLNNIMTSLSNDCDILYLICHGMFAKGETWLLLQDDSGAAKPIKGSDFVARLTELQQRPRLIILASCQTASGSSSLASLGPRIAEAGVPAVIAMQSYVTVETVSLFMPVLFKELVEDGQIDRAMAFARNTISERPDCSFPVLFMRLYNGKIWYEPRFSQDDRSLRKWTSLMTSILKGTCTPILGSGLLDPFIGSTKDVARNLASLHRFPLSESALDALPQVCQYLETTQSLELMQFEVRLECSRQILRRFSPSLPSLLRGCTLQNRLSNPAVERELEVLLREAWESRSLTDETEPIRVLAHLPFRRYLKTFPDSLLEHAMPGDKHPIVKVYDWRQNMTSHSSQSKGKLEPSIETPMISYLFGRFDIPDTLVWSEDNYFEYLINITKQDPKLRVDLTSTLANSALLFLGFRLQEWDFRILHRSILALGGSEHARRYAHVAVQIDPADSNVERGIDQLRYYLESYFNHVNVSIYWGGIDDFARELWNRYAAFDPGLVTQDHG
jgi:hypothetical protein